MSPWSDSRACLHIYIERVGAKSTPNQKIFTIVGCALRNRRNLVITFATRERLRLDSGLAVENGRLARLRSYDQRCLRSHVCGTKVSRPAIAIEFTNTF